MNGPGIVSAGQQGIVYTIPPGEGGGRWYIYEGDATISGSPWEDSVVINAGSSGTFGLGFTRCVFSPEGGCACSRVITVDSQSGVGARLVPEPATLRSVPNPTRSGGTLLVPSSISSSAEWISVFDVEGRRLSRQASIASGAGRLSWSAAGLPAGSYFVRVEDRDGKMLGSARVVVIP